VNDVPRPPEPSHPPQTGVNVPRQPPTPDGAEGGRPAAGGARWEQATADGSQGGAPTPETGAAAERPARSRRQVVGIVLAVALSVVAVACVGALGTGFFVYRKVSEPDRSTPGVVVRQYLQATFDDRNETKAARFTCGKPAEITQVQQALADVVSREKRFDVHITVGWENFTTKVGTDRATVTNRVKIAVPEAAGQSSESFQQWNFELRQRSGWRVCDAQRIG
jgi:hypothetical protein